MASDEPVLLPASVAPVPALNAENGFNFLIEEIGTAGILVLLALWLRVFVDEVRVVRSAQRFTTRFVLAVVVTTTGTTLLIWFGANPTTGPPSAPLFWFTAGVVAWVTAQGDDLRRHTDRNGAS